MAELVHKAHLLCLLGRGRLIDSACNDTLIQVSLLFHHGYSFLKHGIIALLKLGNVGYASYEVLKGMHGCGTIPKRNCAL